MAEARFQTTQLPCSVDLDQLAQECRDLPTRPSYSLSIQPDVYQVVKKRCADVINASDPQNQAITTEEADHAWKCRRMSQGLELKKQAASRTPASFSFDTYENVGLYAQSIPMRDTNAADTKPLQMTKHPHKLTLPADGSIVFVLQVSVYSRRHVPLTRRTRGLDGWMPDMMFDSPMLSNMDGELVLTQQLECLSEHTLDDLVHEIVCRNDELPYACRESSDCPTHWTSANDAGPSVQPKYPKYHASPLPTDVCVMMDNKLYGRLDPSLDPSQSYVHAILEHTHPSASPLAKAVYSGKTLSSTRLTQLRSLTLHQPNWLLHVGDCEHIWCIDGIRLLGSNENADIYPRTVYIQRWMLSSLVRQYLAPKKLVGRNDRLSVPCDICDGTRDAVVLVLGGDAVVCSKNGKRKLTGMPQLVTPCCAVCFQMATGTDVSHVWGPNPPSSEDNGTWTVMPLFTK